MNIISKFRHRIKYSAEEKYHSGIISEFIENDIPFIEDKCTDGKFCFYLFSRHADYVKGDGRIKEISHHGFRQTVLRYKHRIGLLPGALLIILMLMLSSEFVFDVRIITSGGENEAAVSKALKDMGIKAGCYIPKINKKRSENLLLISCPELSYASINIKGNVVYVTTDERLTVEKEAQDDAPCDLTASEDGVVVRYEVNDGSAACTIGQTVRRDQVLISGSVETKHHGTVFVKAKGKVYARVERCFTVTVPFEQDVMLETGRQENSYALLLGGFTLPIGKQTAEFKTSTVSHSVKDVVLFGFLHLPFRIESIQYRETELNHAVYTYEECRSKLDKEYEKMLDAVAYGGEIIYVEREDKETKDGIMTNVRVGLIANICKETPFNIENTP